MVLKAFSVFDQAAEAYLQPFFMRTTGEALRSFKAAVNKEGHQFNMHADDYVLFHVGEFDEDTGLLTATVAPVSLGVAVEYIERPRFKQLDLEEAANAEG